MCVGWWVRARFPVVRRVRERVFGPITCFDSLAEVIISGCSSRALMRPSDMYDTTCRSIMLGGGRWMPGGARLDAICRSIILRGARLM